MKKYLLFALALASMSASAQVEFTIAPLSYKQIAPTKVEVSKAASKDASNTVVSDYVVPQTVEHDGVTYTVKSVSANLNITVEGVEKATFAVTAPTGSTRPLTFRLPVMARS